MIDATPVPTKVGDWLRANREQYRWPEASNREQSEKRIDELATTVKLAFERRNPESLKDAVIKIHHWKSNRTAERYKKSLENLKPDYFERLLVLSRYSDTSNLEDVIRHLKVDFCNLPVCTAIASFLYGRRNAPIIDIYVAQFFAGRFNINRYDDEMQAVLSWIEPIHFKLETYSAQRRKLRLAVYSDRGFEDNLRMYIGEFVPECERIAKALNTGGYSYFDSYGKGREFTPVDVEMSIFSWAMKNKNLADVVPTEHHYIVRKEGILSREPIVKGTRTPVRAIVELTRMGYAPEDILEGLPHLTLAAIFDALSYYKEHRKEIDEYIERNKIPDYLLHPSVRDL